MEEEKKSMSCFWHLSTDIPCIQKVIQICLEWDWRSSSFLTCSLFHFYNSPCFDFNIVLWSESLGRNQELALSLSAVLAYFPWVVHGPQVLLGEFSLPHLELFLYTSRRLQEQNGVTGGSASNRCSCVLWLHQL